MLVAAALTVIPAAVAGARAQTRGFTAFDHRLLADMNSARANHGLSPVQLSSQLQPLAHKWAEHMAATQHSYDNPHLRRSMNAACPGWRHIGEAVGVAGQASADQLFGSYMRDRSRRDSILNKQFHVVGISTVATDESGSTVHWNAIEFANGCGG
jgi:uncharacterized protein YkwD